MKLKELLARVVATLAIVLGCGYGWFILSQPSVAKTNLTIFLHPATFVGELVGLLIASELVWGVSSALVAESMLEAKSVAEAQNKCLAGLQNVGIEGHVVSPGHVGAHGSWWIFFEGIELEIVTIARSKCRIRIKSRLAAKPPWKVPLLVHLSSLPSRKRNLQRILREIGRACETNVSETSM